MKSFLFLSKERCWMAGIVTLTRKTGILNQEIGKDIRMGGYVHEKEHGYAFSSTSVVLALLNCIIITESGMITLIQPGRVVDVCVDSLLLVPPDST